MGAAEIILCAAKIEVFRLERLRPDFENTDDLPFPLKQPGFPSADPSLFTAFQIYVEHNHPPSRFLFSIVNIEVFYRMPSGSAEIMC